MKVGKSSRAKPKQVTERDPAWNPETETFYEKRLAFKIKKEVANKKDLEGKKLITARELSALISVPKYTILKLRRTGKIRAYSPTATLLFDPVEVVEDIKKLSAKQKPEEA